jgi:hypothetical protein
MTMLWSIKKPSYSIVLYNELIYFLYYGGPPTEINAAIIVNGGKVIVVMTESGVEMNYFFLYFID